MCSKNISSGDECSGIEELHSLLGLPGPLHPLISLIDYNDLNKSSLKLSHIMLRDFYKICFRWRAGDVNVPDRNHYDFDDGELLFILSDHTIADEAETDVFGGQVLIFHHNFIHGFLSGEMVSLFHFFSYSSRECIFLSEREKSVIISVFSNIKYELNNGIDAFSRKILSLNIKLLLSYGKRFYERQFLMRAQNGNFPLK